MEQLMMQLTADMMATGGEPWRSASPPGHMADALTSAGFQLVDDLDHAALNTRYFTDRRDGLQIAGGGFRYIYAVKQ